MFRLFEVNKEVREPAGGGHVVQDMADAVGGDCYAWEGHVVRAAAPKTVAGGRGRRHAFLPFVTGCDVKAVPLQGSAEDIATAA